jgi:hypothetical protein
MPFKVVSGAGVGAAAVVVGLSLAGPQALGVANADTSAADSTSVSAGLADPSVVSGQTRPPARPAASRAGRGVKPSESVVSGVRPLASADVTSARVARGLASVKDPAAEPSRQRPAASSKYAPSASTGLRAVGAAVAEPSDGGQAETDVLLDAPEATAVPLAAVGAADGAAEPGRAERGAAVRGLSDHGYTALQAQAVASRYMFFDGASNWLNSLPASPVTDFLQGALVLMRRTFLPYREVVAVGEGVDPYDLPTAPPANFDTGKYTWYATRDNGADLYPVSLQPILRAGFGAPLLDGLAREDYSKDGVRGFIINNSKNAIVIEIDNVESGYIDTQAVLVPGARVAFLLNTRNDFFSPSVFFNSIDLYNWDGEGKPIDSRRPKRWTELTLRDPFVGYPETRFYPDGVRPYSNQRSYSEGESHSELWGQTDIWVKREYLPPQGWVPELSKEFQDRYPNSYDIDKTRDWPIFTIVVNNLFW